MNHWIKTHIAAAGLGGFEVKSSHHASSTTALLSGIPLDKIIDQVGWSTASMLPMMENMVTMSVTLDLRTSVLDDQHNFSKLWQRQPKCVSSSGALIRSKTFVKIQEKKINNACARLHAVIKGQGGESSPMTSSVQQPSKLSSKIKTKLKLSKFDASSKVPPAKMHKESNTTTLVKAKITAGPSAINNKHVKCTQKSDSALTQKAKQDLLSHDILNREKLSKILAPVREAKEMDLIDNFDIVYSESGILVIRAENITKEDLDRFVTKVSPLPLPEMSAENILSEID